MRKRTSRIFPDGITECNEAYAPFDDGWQYCDAIYKCDESGVMTCLWEKLAGKKLVSKPYVRVVAIRYIDGITYAMLFIYYGSAYTNGNYWVARYDSYNNRWIGIFMCNPPSLGLSSNGYVALVATKKGMMISTFVYNSNQGKFLFSSHKFAKVDKLDLDALTFEKKTEGGFLEENEVVMLYPDYGYSNTSGYTFSPRPIEKYGYYQSGGYYKYNGELIESNPVNPTFKAQSTKYRMEYDRGNISEFGERHYFYNIYYIDQERNTSYIDRSLFENEYVSHLNPKFTSSFYLYEKQLCPVIVQDESERVIIPIVTGQYKTQNVSGNTEVDTGMFLNVLIFTGQETLKACDRIKLGDDPSEASNAEVTGAYCLGEYYVYFVRYKENSEYAMYPFFGTMTHIEKIDYNMKNFYPGGAMIIDGKLCVLDVNKNDTKYNQIVMIENGTATTVTIPTYAWQEE